MSPLISVGCLLYTSLSFQSTVVRDYSTRVEADIAYCDDVSVVLYGHSRDVAVRELGKGSRISKHDVREYYISKDLVLADVSIETSGVPHFQ